MSQSDEDVAAVLGVTPASLAAKPPQPSRRLAAGIAMGLTLLLLTLIVALRWPSGASLRQVLERRVQVAEKEKSVRHALPAPAAHVQVQAPQAVTTDDASNVTASTSAKIAKGLNDDSHAAAPAIVPVEPVSVSPSPPRRMNDTVGVARAERLRTPAAPPEIAYEPSPQRRALTWLAEPSEKDVSRFYPADAFADGVSGSVLLSCRERLDGSVDLCQVLDETPADAGFGRAALQLSRRFRFTPYVVDGRVDETTVTIPYEFAVED